MTLQEIVYQIDGKLNVEFQPDNSTSVVLLDNTQEPAKVKMTSDRKEVEARATGRTPSEAEDNLVKLLRGNILKHEWPVMWTSTSAMLRIPDSLVVSNVADFVSHE